MFFGLFAYVCDFRLRFDFGILDSSAYHDGINSSSQRQLISYPPATTERRLLTEGVFRKDIAQLMV
jgi:hypothetical protein